MWKVEKGGREAGGGLMRYDKRGGWELKIKKDAMYKE